MQLPGEYPTFSACNDISDETKIRKSTHKQSKISDLEITSVLENVSKVVSEAEEPLSLTKDTSYNDKISLSGYHLSTRKGSRSVLMNQTSEDMELFLHELLKKIDARVTPKIEDDDVGGKWIQSIYCPGIYDIECLIFHLTPNRSLDYLEDFKEIPNYFSKCSTNHNILAAVLDAKCINGNACTYRTVFYPHVNKPGPIFMPEYVRHLLENERHGLGLSAAMGLVDLLCSFFAPIIDQLNLKNNKGEKITASCIDYQSDMIFDKTNEFENIKWAHHLCICCVFMKQAKISLQACSGNWITNESNGENESDPLERITLLGFKPYVETDVKASINCFSNVLNINGYKMTSFIKFPFAFYDIKLRDDNMHSEPQFEVVFKQHE